VTLLISASWEGMIIGMSHWHLTEFLFICLYISSFFYYVSVCNLQQRVMPEIPVPLWFSRTFADKLFQPGNVFPSTCYLHVFEPDDLFLAMGGPGGSR
jgi:hypothetical protein